MCKMQDKKYPKFSDTSNDFTKYRKDYKIEELNYW